MGISVLCITLVVVPLLYQVGNSYHIQDDWNASNGNG